MTALITDSKDERLEFDTLCPQCGPRPLLDEDGACASCGADAQGPGVDEVMQSLRAALKKLASWDNINKEGPDEPTVFITKERYDRLTSVETRAEKTEAQLCGAKEQALLTHGALLEYKETNGGIRGMFFSIKPIIDALEQLSGDFIAALSSPAPCRHEEEAKRLADVMVHLLQSSDVSWYTGNHGGHDWREAVDEAHLLLVKMERRCATKEGK